MHSLQHSDEKDHDIKIETILTWHRSSRRQIKATDQELTQFCVELIPTALEC